MNAAFGLRTPGSRLPSQSGLIITYRIASACKKCICWITKSHKRHLHVRLRHHWSFEGKLSLAKAR